MSFLARPSLGGKGMLMKPAPKVEAPAFSFPLLPLKDIVECLHSLGMHVEEEDLTKLKPELTRSILELMLSECAGVTSEELNTRKQLEEDDVLPYEELHDESVGVVHFMRAMNKLLHASGVTESFPLHDLIKPDPARLRRYLSAIINFQKYREEKVDYYAALEARSEAKLAQLERLEREKADLLAQIAREKALRAAEQPAIDAATGEIRALAADQQALEAQATRLRASVDDTKRLVVEVRETTKLVDLKIEGTRAEMDDKRGHIVASPQRLKAELDTAARAVDDAKAALATAEAERGAAACRVEVVEKADNTLRKTIGMLGELEVEVVKLKRAAREAKTRKEAADASKQDDAALASQVEHLEKTLRRGEERHEELQRAKYISDEASHRTAKTLRTELAALNEEIARAREARRAADARKAEIDGEKERAQARHQAEMADMLSSMKAVQRSVMEYHVRLAKALAEAAQPAPGTGGMGMGGISGSSSAMHVMGHHHSHSHVYRGGGADYPPPMMTAGGGGFGGSSSAMMAGGGQSATTTP